MTLNQWPWIWPRSDQDVRPYKNKVSVSTTSKVIARTEKDRHTHYENITSTAFAGGSNTEKVNFSWLLFSKIKQYHLRLQIPFHIELLTYVRLNRLASRICIRDLIWKRNTFRKGRTFCDCRLHSYIFRSTRTGWALFLCKFSGTFVALLCKFYIFGFTVSVSLQYHYSIIGTILEWYFNFSAGLNQLYLVICRLCAIFSG